MPAGRNQIARLWRYSTPTDDEVGGALPSGTVLHENLLVRISPKTPTMALLEQGIETVKIFETAMSWIAQDVKENDILQVYEPYDSQYAGEEFRVISVRLPSMRPNDPRSQVQVTLRRWEGAHGRQP